jgi:hypothetical protein
MYTQALFMHARALSFASSVYAPLPACRFGIASIVVVRCAMKHRALLELGQLFQLVAVFAWAWWHGRDTRVH